MESSLAFKLVVATPSFLLLTGFFLKGILEAHNLKKLDLIISKLDSDHDSKHKEDLQAIFNALYTDFWYVFSLESMFVLVVNGLIIIFEFDKIEFGIILIIVSLIIFLITTIGTHTGNRILVAIGVMNIMTILGWEFGYFLSYDLEKIWGIQSQDFILYSILVCIVISLMVGSSIAIISKNLSYEEIVSKIKK